MYGHPPHGSASRHGIQLATASPYPGSHDALFSGVNQTKTQSDEPGARPRVDVSFQCGVHVRLCLPNTIPDQPVEISLRLTEAALAGGDAHTGINGWIPFLGLLPFG